MNRTLLVSLLAAVFCLGVTGQPLLALKKVVRGTFDICTIDGGQVATVCNAGGCTEVCCAHERKPGDPEDGPTTGPGYCVQCDPPGSDNCELIPLQRPGDLLGNILLGAVLAEQQGIRVEQQRVSEQLGEILTRLVDLQSRADNVVAACAPPDLLPVPIEGSLPPGFCRGDGQGNLIVRVKNQGLAAAPASTLRVTFSTPSGPVPVEVSTPALAGSGGGVDLTIPIPADCFLPADPLPSACNFRIAVDLTDVVVENSETNNIVSGICVPIL